MKYVFVYVASDFPTFHRLCRNDRIRIVLFQAYINRLLSLFCAICGNTTEPDENDEDVREL